MTNKKEQEMYSRQIMMKEIGEAGQQKLSKASVLVVGCGGLGSPVLYYLTAMGVGHIGICDGDTVSLQNLNRQILFKVDDIGKSKATVARERLIELNPNLITTVYNQFLDEKLAESLIPSYDIVVDCLDNFETRFILNDVCVNERKPLVHAGICEYFGQLMTITPGKGPCLRCLFPKGIQKKEDIKPSGVIGPTPGVLGAMQAMETAKYLLDMKICNDGLVMYNGLELTLEKVKIPASPHCICMAAGS